MSNVIRVGYTVRKEVAGWCLFQNRKMFELFGYLDERIKFWFADNFYSVYCQKYAIPHVFVGNSIVYHHEKLEGTTTKDSGWSDEKKYELTYGAGDEFRTICREFLGDPNFGREGEKQKKRGKNIY